MADIEITAPEGTEVQEEPVVVEISPIEQKALDMGWRPKDDFDGPEEDFIDAKEFVRRKPLFDKIEQQSKEVKALRRTLEEFKEHYTKVEEAQYKKALAALKEQRKDALKDGDGDRFEALDDQIKEAEQEVAQIRAVRETTPETPAQEPAEFINWKRVNTWYTQNQDMRGFADDYGTSLARRGIPPDEVLKRVTEAVRKQFPEKFVNKNKQSAPDVESSKGRSTGRSESYELTETERKIMNDFVRQGVMTKDEYIASLKQVKGKA